MTSPLQNTSHNQVSPPSNALRWWLILATIAAIGLAALALVFGWLINMDTKIEMNPNGDPLVRQGAIELRTVAWIGVAILIVLLAAAVLRWWRLFRSGRNRSALGLSLTVVIPVVILVSAVIVGTLRSL